jgi:hypothetical protein
LSDHLKRKDIIQSIKQKFKAEDDVCHSSSKVVEWKKRAKFLPLAGILEFDEKRSKTQMLRNLNQKIRKLPSVNQT